MDKYDFRRKLESIGNVSGEVWVTSLALGSTALAAVYVGRKFYKQYKEKKQAETLMGEIAEGLSQSEIGPDNLDKGE